MSHARSWARTLFFAPLVLLSFSYAAHAAGDYLQTFDTDPGWVKVDAWNVTNGRYANTNSAPFRVLSYFSGRRWTTDFTYSLQMDSDLSTGGNHKVGAVFSLVDENNYYEVVIAMAGTVENDGDNVELYEVSGGQRTWRASGKSTVPVKDVPFDVAIVRSGASKVRVRIGQSDVFNAVLPNSPPPGFIGVVTQFNRGRFDDVKVTPVVFRSGFGNGVELTAWDCDHLTYWQRDIGGTELATGTVWPPTFWGEHDVAMMNTILDCSQLPEDAFEVKLFVPPGESSRVLSSKVTNVHANPDDGDPNTPVKLPRLGLSYTVGAEGNVPNRFYVRRYLKYSDALKNPGPGLWFMQHEFKNMSCNDPEPPRRLTLGLLTTTAGVPYYRLRMDQENTVCENIPDSTAAVAEFPDLTCYPRDAGAPCPDFTQKAGQWFYDEYLVQYSTNGSSTSDRVAYAINGKLIFDFPDRQACDDGEDPGEHCKVRSTSPRGIKLTPGYINISNVEVHVDDLEVYHDVPCRTFPCGAPSHYN